MSSYVGLMGPGTHEHTLQRDEHEASAIQELLHARVLQVSASPLGTDRLPAATHKLTLKRRPSGSPSSSGMPCVLAETLLGPGEACP